MEKRVDRNKELYVVVNEKIKQKALNTANKELHETQLKLQGINPSLFGGEEKNIVPKDKQSNKKKIILTAIVFSIIFLLIIFVAVVISNGK